MADVQTDPTAAGTLRPKRKPLLKTGDAFIFPPGITPLNALGIFELFLPDLIFNIVVQTLIIQKEGHIGLGNQNPGPSIGFCRVVYALRRVI